MITIKQKGNFSKLDTYLERIKEIMRLGTLDKYGREGVAALASATPVRTGKTAASWNYEIQRSQDQVAVVFNNTNINENVNIAIIIQYGHGLHQGGYIQGRDYINPAIQPVFDRIVKELWEEVKNA